MFQNVALLSDLAKKPADSTLKAKNTPSLNTAALDGSKKRNFPKITVEPVSKTK